MTQMTLIDALRHGDGRRTRPRPARVHHRRGCRRARRRFPRDAGLVREIRRRTRSSIRRWRNFRLSPSASARRWPICARSAKSSSPTSSTRRSTRSSTKPRRCTTARTAAWRVPLVIRAPYGGGISGGLYHSQSVEAFFTHVPGLKIVIPSTPYDAKGLLKSAVRDPNPVLFFEPKKGYRAIKGDVPDDDYTVPIGPARIAREGRDLSVFAYGMMAHYAEIAAEKVAREDGIDAEVIDLRTLLPLDKESDPQLGQEDRQGADRLRGQPDDGLWRGSRRADRRRGVRVSRRAGQAAGGAGCSRRALTATRCRNTSCPTRTPSPPPSAIWRVLRKMK